MRRIAIHEKSWNPIIQSTLEAIGSIALQVPSKEKYQAIDVRKRRKAKAYIFHLNFNEKYILIKPMKVTSNADISQSIA